MTSDEIVNLLRNTCQYEAATLIESQASEFATLKTKLAYAEDAAAKGDSARQQAGGMEMRITELKSQNERLVRALVAILDADSRGELHRDPLDTDSFFKEATALLAEIKL